MKKTISSGFVSVPVEIIFTVTASLDALRSEVPIDLSYPNLHNLPKCALNRPNFQLLKTKSDVFIIRTVKE
ncbi:MAG: hypothetical protein AB1798_09795 [Spirochaetota bacterium]